MSNKLYNSIPNNKIITNDIIKEWDMVIPYLSLEENIGNVGTITPQQADMYRHDFAGLLRNLFLIQKEYIYPTIRVNGYDASHSFDGKRLRILLVKPDVIARYYLAISTKKKVTST